MKSLQKFGLVLWKNWILRKRHFIVTGIEIILPTLLSIILVTINSELRSYRHFSSEIINYTFYENRSLFDRDFYELSGKTLYVSPNTSAVHRIMTSVQTKVNQLPLDRPFKFVAVENENDFLEIHKTTNESFFAGVDFTSNFPYQLDYRLRFAFSYNYFETDTLTENYFINRPYEGVSNYRRSGFLTLQHFIAMSFIESLMTNGSIYSKVKVFSEMFPYPEYETKDSIVEIFTFIISQFIMLSFLFTIPTMTKNIVHEKERGVKELMQMMGLPSWLQWLGWFVSNFILMSFSSLIIVILLCAPIGAPIGVIGHSAPELVFLILLLYIASSILFAFFISTLFNKPSVSTAVCILAWMITYYVPYFIMNSNYFKYNSSSKLATSLFPNTCMAWIFRLILEYENKGIGLQWSELSSPAIRGDSLTVNHLIGMMFACIFIYGFLTWYIDNVFPGVYGVPKPWYFLLTKNYWFKLEAVPEDVGDYPTISSDSFENEPMGLKKGIIIKNLTKNYGWFQTGKLAVDNISLNLFENQITALLGHNGAGKTTTMSVLTGMYPPTKGTAYVNNLDIRTQIDRAREQMGLCPQHNMLFNELTAQEHLEFFAKLKGLRGKELKAEVETYLNKIQLVEKKNVYAMNLSGGMQRKLHLGMALIGNSKIVVLDEPTSGLDPEARRTVWDLLQEVRPGRTILLTTHVMEEADILGDRIAIMSHGRIKCCGTPMFLKQKYGAGYHLNISKADHCDKTALSDLISKCVPDARFNSDVSAELSYILPSNQTSVFPALFTELENNLISLGISGFGVSVTTMEEVFLKVGELAGEEEKDETSSDSTVRLEIFHTEMDTNDRNTGFALLRQQFYGLFTKRIVYNRRRWLLMIFQVLIPVAVAATAFSLINLMNYSGSTDFPSLRMDLSPYGNTKVFCKADEMLATNYVNSLPSGTKAIKVNNVEEALLNLGRTNLRDYRENTVIAGKLFSGIDDVKITAMYNGLFPHSLPTSLNQLHNALLTYYTNIKEASITLVNAPLNEPKYGTTYRYPDECRILGMIMGIFISFGLSFITSSFAILPIHERTSKSKHLQMMTGVGGPIYWGTIFLWDFILYFATTLLLILMIFLLDSSEIFTAGNGLGAVFLLLLLYGLSSLPFSYMMSFLFKLPASGFSALTIINILLGITFSLIVFVFDEHPYLNSTGEKLKWIFGLLPSFPVTLGFMLMSKTCSPSDKYWNDFQWISPDIKQMLGMMIGDCILYLFLLCLIESGVLYKVWYRQCSRNKLAKLLMTETVAADSVDSDVVEEQQRIETLLVSVTGDSLMSDALVIHNLTKQFAALVAVDKLSLGVKNGECFGLLGVNGAGKTTTFRMLTGDELITDGNAYFQGTSLIDKRRQFLKQISYCPQFDALIDFLTGRETLYLFARLRGISEKQIPTVVNDVISFVGIQEYADKITKVYSGGNKRKLSVGIALIGQPPMTFLDEPTTGVDPLSRRKIWDILTSVRETGTSLVLTSHSMEECEALCSRIAIMVNGQFKCLGAVQHLKNKYGQGFTIIAKIDSKVGPEMASFQENLQKFIERNFHHCTLKDSHQGMVQYHIADTSTRWAHLFEVMEQAKQEFHLEDYSVSQTTLEQVFISFARTQRADPLQIQTVEEIPC